MTGLLVLFLLICGAVNWAVIKGFCFGVPPSTEPRGMKRIIRIDAVPIRYQPEQINSREALLNQIGLSGGQVQFASHPVTALATAIRHEDRFAASSSKHISPLNIEVWRFIEGTSSTHFNIESGRSAKIVEADCTSDLAGIIYGGIEGVYANPWSFLNEHYPFTKIEAFLSGDGGFFRGVSISDGGISRSSGLGGEPVCSFGLIHAALCNSFGGVCLGFRGIGLGFRSIGLILGLHSEFVRIGRAAFHLGKLQLHNMQLKAIDYTHNSTDEYSKTIHPKLNFFKTKKWLVGTSLLLAALFCSVTSQLYFFTRRDVRLGKRLLYGCSLLVITIVLVYHGVALIVGLRVPE